MICVVALVALLLALWHAECQSSAVSEHLHSVVSKEGTVAGRDEVNAAKSLHEVAIDMPCREAAACAGVGGTVVVFGGGVGKAALRNDTWILWEDTARTKWSWDYPRMGTAPPTRWKFSLTSTDSAQVVLFGGSRFDTHSIEYALDDLWKLSVANGTFAWTAMEKQATWPPARHSHAAAWLGKELYIFGGRAETAVLGDTWVLEEKLGIYLIRSHWLFGCLIV